jgi:hypothetical protein
MDMLTTTKALEVLRANGVKVSYPTIALWVREGKFAGAELEETPRGPVWKIPRASVERFEPPTRGRPPALKPEDEAANGQTPTKRAAKKGGK